jgi:hypothetical protein
MDDDWVCPLLRPVLLVAGFGAVEEYMSLGAGLVVKSWKTAEDWEVVGLLLGCKSEREDSMESTTLKRVKLYESSWKESRSRRGEE